MTRNFLAVLPFLLQSAWASESMKTIRLCDNGVASIYISTKGSVLDFPAYPEKVFLGTKNTFSIDYIRNDVAISPNTLNSRSNLFVYLQGRRFTLDLATAPGAPALYFIRDCHDDKISEKKRGK